MVKNWKKIYWAVVVLVSIIIFFSVRPGELYSRAGASFAATLLAGWFFYVIINGLTTARLIVEKRNDITSQKQIVKRIIFLFIGAVAFYLVFSWWTTL